METLNKIDFSKSNVLLIGADKSSVMKDIYSNHIKDGRVVYFFEEGFDGLEYYPSEPSMIGPIKMHNGVLDGIRTILVGISIGGRKDVTLMLNWNIVELKEYDNFEMLKSLMSSDNNCNLIMLANSLDEVEGLDFDTIIS